MPEAADRLTSTSDVYAINHKRKRNESNSSHNFHSTAYHIEDGPQDHDRKGSQVGNLASPAKRARLDLKQGSQPLPAAAMFDFKSSHKPRRVSNINPSAVIDLTGSSPPRRPLQITRQPVITLPSKGDAKVIQIRNLRTTKPNVQAFYDQTAQKLDKALNLILNNGHVPFSNEDLYKSVENLCRQGRAKDLSSRLIRRLDEHMKSTVKSQLQSVMSKSPSPPDLLRKLLEAWSLWNKQVIFIRNIFYFLERTYLMTQSRRIDEIARETFKGAILEDAEFSQRILEGFCDIIESDRAGKSPDLTLLSQAAAMFTATSSYHSSLEPKVMDDSQQYFDTWASQHSKRDGLAQYACAILALFDAENTRCNTIGLNTSTKRALSESIELIAIKMQIPRLSVESELWSLLDDNSKEDLEKIYSLLGRVRASDALIAPFTRWISDRGSKIVFDEDHEEEMVIRLLALKRQIDSLWIESFHRDPEYASQLRTAFHGFMNETKKSKANYGTGNTKQGEMIAKYVNMLLEGGSKVIPSTLSQARNGITTATIEDNEVQDENEVINEQLDQVLDLFRFLEGKAVFEAFYKRDLARRLLLGRSASTDAELSMITRLKNECGAGFTQNIETMFKDMDLSREEMSEYNSRQAEAQIRFAVDLNVHVLSSAAWPSYPDISFNVPKEVRDVLQRFELKYVEHHKSRKLFWKYALHHTSIVAQFPKGKRELIVSAFQAAVLLMFNSVRTEEWLSYEAIKAEIGLPDDDLRLTLQSLACARLRPLTKQPQGRDIGKSDKFTVNQKFHSDKYRVKINRIQQKETKKETQETHERVALDREFETQAAIVRIMKSKKEYAHVNLMADVIDATRKRGTMSPADIKRQIDRLIEKDYLCRLEEEDPSKVNIYGYVA